MALSPLLPEMGEQRAKSLCELMLFSAECAVKNFMNILRFDAENLSGEFFGAEITNNPPSIFIQLKSHTNTGIS